MKKIISAILCVCVLTAFLAACDSDKDKPSQTSGTEAVTASETESAAVNDGIGGSDKTLYYMGKYRRDFYGIDTSFNALVGENGNEIVGEWLNTEYNFSNTEGDWKKPFSILDFIKEFNINKEDFISVNENMGIPRYTDEEIDALFSDDIQQIYDIFLSPNAFYINGTVYTPNMIHGLSLDEMKAIGITEADISEKMSNWGQDLSYTQFYSDMVELCKENDIDYEVFDWSDEEPAMEYDYSVWTPETLEAYFTEQPDDTQSTDSDTAAVTDAVTETASYVSETAE